MKEERGGVVCYTFSRIANERKKNLPAIEEISINRGTFKINGTCEAVKMFRYYIKQLFFKLNEFR